MPIPPDAQSIREPDTFELVQRFRRIVPGETPFIEGKEYEPVMVWPSNLPDGEADRARWSGRGFFETCIDGGQIYPTHWAPVVGRPHPKSIP